MERYVHDSLLEHDRIQIGLHVRERLRVGGLLKMIAFANRRARRSGNSADGRVSHNERIGIIENPVDEISETVGIAGKPRLPLFVAHQRAAAAPRDRPPR